MRLCLRLPTFVVGFGLALAAFATGAGGPQASQSPPFETRCGWLDNPTPGNFWLVDRDGEWEISTQGGASAQGPGLPDFGKQWVASNGSYGYGCACMQAKVDRKEKRILVYRKVRVQPLVTCRRDPRLKGLRE